MNTKETRKEWWLKIRKGFFDSSDDVWVKVRNAVNLCIAENDLYMQWITRDENKFEIHSYQSPLEPEPTINIRFWANPKTEDQKYVECLEYFIENLNH